MPLIKVTTANTDFNRGHNKDYVRQLCEWSDVILLQEAKDMRLADCVPDGWKALQDSDNDATKGSAIAFDKDKWRCPSWYLKYGCPPPPDNGMLTRWICCATLEHRETGKTFTAISAHEPPERYDFMQPEFTANLKEAKKAGHRCVIGTDANMPLEDLAKQIGGKPYGYGIVGVITGQAVDQCTYRGYGEQHGMTDHPAVTCHVELS